ncbi:PREDICTED: uncharacterized protein LOC103337585 [Prunus mume]|uniref:Uncharacterized protein LOC103337585 n=1 Tax=Prunus mume TaxID=102107 RepID=A0ABM0PFP8_PRUMU|nr:PREDICTED: uncharacterized protein LOC103337585 [Prunus mume]
MTASSSTRVSLDSDQKPRFSGSGAHTWKEGLIAYDMSYRQNGFCLHVVVKASFSGNPQQHCVWALSSSNILLLLKSRNLLSFVNGASVAPSPFLQDDKGKLTDAINPAYDTWIQQDQLVLSWINGSLRSTVLATVTRFTSARSTWVALENHFASPNQNRILQLRSELFRTARGDSSIAVYLDKVNAIVDNLALSGSPLPDSDLLAVIMNNVGPLYESTVASAQARETPITYADLEAFLLSDEQRHLMLHAPARDGPATAMVAAHGHASSRGRCRGSGRFSFRGGHSGGSAPWFGSSFATGHLGFRGSSSSHGSGRASFSSPGGSSSQPGVLGPPPTAAAGFSSSSASFFGLLIRCQICGRYGHSALDCYNRLNMSNEGPQHLTAMTAQQSSSPRPPNWVVDTGANSHITNDLGNLSLSREYHGHDSVDGVLGGTETKGAHAHISSSYYADSAPPLQVFGSLPNQQAASQPHGHQIVTPTSPSPSSPLPNATNTPTIVASQTTQHSPPSSLQVYRHTPHRTVLTFPSPEPDLVLPSSSRHSSPSATSREWRTAMGEEFNALQRAGTWVLIPPKPTLNVLPNKWVFRIKRNSDGSVQRYKARLVANGFHQQEGLDYGNDPTHISTLIQDLSRLFSMKDLGPVHYFLGIEVLRTPNGLSLTQSKYIKDLLTRTKMQDAKHISSSVASGRRLSLHNGVPLDDPSEYRSVVDYAGDPDDRRSTSGYCLYLGALFRDLQLSFSCPKLWCDNISAISLAFNLVFHALTRHVEVDYHYVREKVVRQELDVRYLRPNC